MIEFNGYISGAAEKRFFQKSQEIGQALGIVAVLLISPPCALAGFRMRFWIPLILCGILLVSIPLLVRIPQSQKKQKELLPKRIYTEDGYTVCIADKYTESKLIADVKQVYDYGEYYELVFPFGKISDKFICQKSLLSNGTLEEFEALFEGKLERCD